MKKISLFIALCSLVFIVFFAGICAWYGYFTTLIVQEKPVGPFLIVFEKHSGSPASAAPMVEEIQQNLRMKFNIDSPVNFSLYYDDPQVVAPDQCRALVGTVIAYDQNIDLHRIAQEYSIATIPRGMAAVVDYPYKNKISILFAALRGYPALLEYGKAHHLGQQPVLQLNDLQRGRIRYAVFTAFDAAFLESYLLIDE
jgi:DNA gyrase inhibitor GyrI